MFLSVLELFVCTSALSKLDQDNDSLASVVSLFIFDITLRGFSNYPLYSKQR